MTVQQISFTADEEMDESHFMNYGFPRSFSPLSSPKQNQPTHADLEDHEIPLDGCFSSGSFDWNVGVAEEPQTAAAQFSANCSRDTQPVITSYDACSSVASLRHQEMQQPLAMEQDYPSLYAAQPASVAPKAPHDFLSAVQEFACSTTSADNAHLPRYDGTVTDPNPSLKMSTLVESAQFYSAMRQATLDRVAAVEQQRHPSACLPDASPSNTETAELCSVDVAPSDPPRSACGSPDFEFFCDEQPDQEVQEVQSLKSCAQLKEDEPEFNPDVISSGVESNIGQHALQEDEDNHPTRLSIPADKQFLDPVHNFLRSSCVEVFLCGDASGSGAQKRGTKHKEGQIGLRCAFCHHIPKRKRANQAVSYPSKTAHIFESVRNYQRIHFDACEYIPTELKMKHRGLMAKKSNRKIHLKYVKVYFAEAACEIGMVETANGLFFGASPNTSGTPSEKLRAIMRLAENPSALKDQSLMDLVFPKVDERVENAKFSHIVSANTHQVIDNCRQEKAAFVFPSDFPTFSDFRFVLFHQFAPCRPSAAALSKRKVKAEKLNSLSGLCCKHCARAHQGEDHGGMYFPLDLESLHDSSFAHHLTFHMFTCQHVPLKTREALEELQHLAAEHGVITKRGAKRMFLKKLWNRMSNYYSSS